MKVDDNLHKQAGKMGRLESEQSLNDLSDFHTFKKHALLNQLFTYATHYDLYGAHE